jgi:hypothetical protein
MERVNWPTREQTIRLSSADTTSVSLGKAILSIGQVSLTVNTTAVASSSAVFITPSTVIDTPLAVSSQQDGQFTVEIAKPAPHDIEFKWWIIN